MKKAVDPAKDGNRLWGVVLSHRHSAPFSLLVRGQGLGDKEFAMLHLSRRTRIALILAGLKQDQDPPQEKPPAPKYEPPARRGKTVLSPPSGLLPTRDSDRSQTSCCPY